MSSESPTFDPDDLPSDSRLEMEAENEFELLEQGSTPDEIVEAKEIVREVSERIKPELDEILREDSKRMMRRIREDEQKADN